LKELEAITFKMVSGVVPRMELTLRNHNGIIEYFSGNAGKWAESAADGQSGGFLDSEVAVNY
jgi:hypothetical protein